MKFCWNLGDLRKNQMKTDKIVGFLRDTQMKGIERIKVSEDYGDLRLKKKIQMLEIPRRWKGKGVCECVCGGVTVKGK